MSVVSVPEKVSETVSTESTWRIPATLRQQLLEVLLAGPEQPDGQKMTYEQFLAWADEDTLAEWVNGEVVMTSPSSGRHQEIVGFLYKLLSAYVQDREFGTVYIAPFQMKLERSGREPDLFLVAQEHLHRLKETYLDGPADLVVEIVSPESQGRDRGDKFYEYEAAGVPEYWLIDPEREWAEFFVLQGQRYRLVLGGERGEYHSTLLPGFWLRVEWFWQRPLPAVEEVLLDVGGEGYARRWVERLRQRGLLPPV